MLDKLSDNRSKNERSYIFTTSWPMIHWKIGVQIFVTGLAKLKMRDPTYLQQVDQLYI